MFKLLRSLGVSKIIFICVILGLSFNNIKLHIQRNKAINKTDSLTLKIAELNKNINELKAINSALDLNIDSLTRQIANNDQICIQELERKEKIYKILKNSSTVTVHTPIKSINRPSGGIKKEVPVTVEDALIEEQYIEVVDSETSKSVINFINDVYGTNSM